MSEMSERLLNNPWFQLGERTGVFFVNLWGEHPTEQKLAELRDYERYLLDFLRDNKEAVLTADEKASLRLADKLRNKLTLCLLEASLQEGISEERKTELDCLTRALCNAASNAYGHLTLPAEV